MNTPLGSHEVKSINRMFHGYLSQILQEDASASEYMRIVPEVVTVLRTLPAERVDIFDVPLSLAIECDNPDFWNAITSKDDVADCGQKKMGANINWRLKVINRTILLFARDLARENTKLCQCMLGVSKNVADKLVKISILKINNLTQEHEQPLFTIREGDNQSFWGNVAGCNIDDRRMVKILNNRIKMRCFTQIFPAGKELSIRHG
ncbi:MAG: hypothetical protein ACYC9J_06280 [Sulfuricaulis sp.]